MSTTSTPNFVDSKVRRMTSNKVEPFQSKAVQTNFLQTRKRVRKTERQNCRLLPNLWFIVCLIGCIVQSIFVTNDYLAYKTISNIEVSTLKSIDNIAISICVGPMYSFKRSLLSLCLKLPEDQHERYSRVFKSRNNSLTQRRLTTMTSTTATTTTTTTEATTTEKNVFGDLFKDLNDKLDNLTKIIDSVKATSGKGDVNCYQSYHLTSNDLVNNYSENVAESVTSFELRGKSYSVRSDVSNGPRVSTTDFLRRSGRCVKVDLSSNSTIVTNPLFEISLAASQFNSFVGKVDFELAIHDKNRFPHIYDVFMTSVTYSQQTAMNGRGFSISKMDTKQLRHPFESNCIDYDRENNFASRGDCIENCFQHLLMQKYNLIYPYIRTTDKYDDVIPDDVKDLGQDELTEIDEMCSERCNQECKTSQYHLSLRDVRAQPVPFVASFSCHVDMPQVLIEHEPYLELLQYLIFVAGVIGMWLGSSLYEAPIELTGKVYRMIK